MPLYILSSCITAFAQIYVVRYIIKLVFFITLRVQILALEMLFNNKTNKIQSQSDRL